MKRISVMALAAGAVALTLTACGGSDSSDDASGLRKGSAPTSTAGPSASAPTSTDSAAAPASPIDTSKLGTASRTSCGDFKALPAEEQKSLVEEILAENPDSTFAGSPNVALGTAKLVCLAGSNAGKPVAIAAGIVTQK
ncbi:hypothetical protein ACFVMC_24475 [Nocardia sp. NPDC127579]|uniref:hypothetical protein n=1 Tax=Nocardia sp. NPDC127579 TaxID=3345402 RepID=UPI003636EFC7